MTTQIQALKLYIEHCLSVVTFPFKMVYLDEYGNTCFSLLVDAELQQVLLDFFCQVTTIHLTTEEIERELPALGFSRIDPNFVPSDARIWVRPSKQQ